MDKIEDILKERLIESLKEEKKGTSPFVIVFAGIGVIAATAAAAYGVYKLLEPDYLDDFEDDFEDDFDDDFFDEDEQKEPEE